MSRLLKTALVAALLLTAGANQALATDQGTAVDLCNKAPKCSVHFGPGGASLFGVNSAGHFEIYCADEGPCVCVACPTPKRLADGLGGIRAIIAGTMPGKVDLTQFGFDADGNSSGRQNRPPPAKD